MPWRKSAIQEVNDWSLNFTYLLDGSFDVGAAATLGVRQLINLNPLVYLPETEVRENVEEKPVEVDKSPSRAEWLSLLLPIGLPDTAGKKQRNIFYIIHNLFVKLNNARMLWYHTFITSTILIFVPFEKCKTFFKSYMKIELAGFYRSDSQERRMTIIAHWLICSHCRTTYIKW